MKIDVIKYKRGEIRRSMNRQTVTSNYLTLTTYYCLILVANTNNSINQSSNKQQQWTSRRDVNIMTVMAITVTCFAYINTVRLINTTMVNNRKHNYCQPTRSW